MRFNVLIILVLYSLLYSQQYIDNIIYSTAKDSLHFSIKNKTYYLYGKAKINYEKSELSSKTIKVDFSKNLLSTKFEDDTSFYPTLIDDGEKYTGKSIEYNFKTKQGIISFASNKSLSSAYSGELVNKVDDKTIFAKDARFTTCSDIDDPDYAFNAKEMKIIPKDKIIARWIYLEFESVPIPVPFPFAVIPNKSGRRSGILIPSYGLREGAGAYFSGMGFYWAMSDYTDLTFRGDYYTRGGYNLQTNFRYNKRYNYDGFVDLGYSNLIFGEKYDQDYYQTKDYKITIVHNQTISPSAKLNANLNYLSGKYLRNNSANYNDILNQNIYSSLVFNKFYDNGTSFSVNYSRNQDLSNNNINEILPSITFNFPNTYIFRTKNTNITKLSWYEQIKFNYNVNLQNNKNKINNKVENKYGIYHKPNISYTPKLGYFSVSPYFNYDEKWYFKYLKIDNLGTNGKDSIVEKEKSGFNAVRTYSLGLNISTTLYGIMDFNALGISGFRHIFKPSFNYSFSPDFSSNKWGYYDSYQLSNGKVVKYDKFSRQVFGGVPAGERQILGFNFTNIHEMKLKPAKNDTVNISGKKIQLLNWNLSSSYNFAADSLNFSDLNLSYRTEIGRLNFSGSNSFTLYDQIGYTRINKFLWNTSKQPFRMTSFRYSLSFKLASSDFASNVDTSKKKYQEHHLYNDFYNTNLEYLNSNWELNLNYWFSQFNPTKDIVTKSSSIGLSLNLALTKNWRASFTGNYDLQQKQITAPQVTLYRDLHCWEMFFYWLPSGKYTNYRLEIRVKASELQDLKITRSRGFYSGK
ncbi:MAG TPA: putative LPS assembly protein LptD [Ignavibacteriales bacterium]|nr:putative LPS assembly protein LptD [Ignavibacteriales bacterium]HOL82294.1 putative LPS assembly protein LptD [Ignavibacteriales bacterium]HOM66352.1 putative LPS assembly protein LptD [Ignavibacteriales bacterium]HPD68158.1 putative LPS assembly protein LptD [Ignavibacteriales bacterium]HPP34513.1 putative LPS assembly protein LptD [Ignavibacteriales bacterium]